MAELIIHSGKHQGKKLRLPDHELVLGRDEECHIRLGSGDVSRRHCVLRPSPEGIRVQDLGSRNGTFVNDVLIKEETLLKPGDRLRVGTIIFLVPSKKKPGEHTGTPKQRPDSVAVFDDDEIAHWLTDEGSTEELHAGDTTTIPTQSPKAGPEEAAAEVPPPPPETPQPSPQKKFASIAEEGADIIRRHREMLRRQEEEEGRDSQNGTSVEE